MPKLPQCEHKTSNIFRETSMDNWYCAHYARKHEERLFLTPHEQHFLIRHVILSWGSSSIVSSSLAWPPCHSLPRTNDSCLFSMEPRTIRANQTIVAHLPHPQDSLSIRHFPSPLARIGFRVYFFNGPTPTARFLQRSTTCTLVH